MLGSRHIIRTPHQTLVVVLRRPHLPHIIHLLLIINHLSPLILIFIFLKLIFIIFFSKGLLLRLEVKDFLDSCLQGHLLFTVESGYLPRLICLLNVPFAQLNLLFNFAYIICHFLIGLLFSGVGLVSDCVWELLFVERHSIQMILTQVESAGPLG